MSCFAKFGKINAISSMSVLPFNLSKYVCSSVFNRAEKSSDWLSAVVRSMEDGDATHVLANENL